MKVNNNFYNIVASDGSDMIAYKKVPENWNGKFVIFANGYLTSFYSTNRVQKHWANTLYNEGYGILRFDYRGYGESDGEFVDANVTSQISDLLYVTNDLIDHYEDGEVKEIVLIGMSLGGLVVKEFIDKYDFNQISKVILLCPALLFYSIYKESYKDTITTTLFDKDSIEYKEKFEEDLRKYQHSINYINSINTEYLLIHGTSDNIIPIDGSREFSNHSNVYLIEIEGAEHNLWSSENIDHFNDSLRNQEFVVKKIIDFIS